MKFWLSIFILVICKIVIAQNNTTPPNTKSEEKEENPSDFILLEEEPDTAKIFYYYTDNLNVKHRVTDTLLGPEFYQYDITRKENPFIGHCGNIGSAVRNLVYTPFNRIGFDAGFHQFDYYFSRAYHLPFYDLTNPYSQVAHSGLMSKYNTTFEAKLARNFAKGVQITFDYRRINNRGLYNRQSVFHTAFNIGFRYFSKNDKYKLFMAYASNVASKQDNGGITSDTIFNDNSNGNFNSTLTLPVKLSGATTRQDIKEFYLKQYYDLRKTDKTNQSRSYLIGHQLLINRTYNRFSDVSPDTNASTSYYKDYLFNQRGLRRYIRDFYVENKFTLATTNSKNQSNSFDWFEIGLQHQWHKVKIDSKDSIIQSLFAIGKWNKQFSSILSLNTYAHLGLNNSYIGDYRLEGNLILDLDKIGKLEGNFIHQRAAPTLIQQQMYVSSQLAWSTDFNKPITTSFGGKINLGKTGIQLGLHYHLIQNYIYFDDIGKPNQENNAISILQFSGKLNWHWGILHNENAVVYQPIAGADAIRLPNFMSNHSLYIEGKLFKKVLTARVGFDARLQSSFKADYYHPLMGQFIQQNTTSIPFGNSIDFVFAAKVKTFRFFLKFDGIQTYFTKLRYYQTYNYPLYDQLIRTGIDWKFSK
mgnify:CR=1 FL=1